MATKSSDSRFNRWTPDNDEEWAAQIVDQLRAEGALPANEWLADRAILLLEIDHEAAVEAVRAAGRLAPEAQADLAALLQPCVPDLSAWYERVGVAQPAWPRDLVLTLLARELMEQWGEPVRPLVVAVAKCDPELQARLAYGLSRGVLQWYDLAGLDVEGLARLTTAPREVHA